MSFLTTLQASRTAIDYFSDRLSLIGENIASTQTPGYDRQRQLPSDNFYQQLTAANAAGGTSLAGGIRTGGREAIFTVGELAPTDQPTDLAINGRGYFPVQDPETGDLRLTRVGSFDLDDDGFLRLPSGHQLMGVSGPDPAFQVSLDAQNNLVFTVDPAVAGASPGTNGTVLQLEGQGANWAAGTLSFSSSAPNGGSPFPTLPDGSILTAATVDAGFAGMNAGQGIDPGLRYASFAELETALARGGLSSAQADGALLRATGGSGLSVAGGTFTSTAELRAALDAGAITLGEIDTAVAAVAPGGLQPAWATQEDIRAGLQAGLFSEATLDAALAATPLTIGGQTFNGSPGNGWSDLATNMPLNPRTGAPYTLVEIQEAAPQALGLKIGSDGAVRWQFSNGTSAPAAWLRLADVREPATLDAVGESLFAPSAHSVMLGDWQTNAPDAGGRGALVAGALEMSNVDLTTEFGDLLASQRSYQANSKMLGVMDELLSTLIALRR